MKRLFFLSVFLVLFICALKAQNRKQWKPPFLSLSLPSLAHDTLVSSAFNLGLISYVNQIQGVGINLCSNFVRKDVRGVLIGGLSNLAGGTVAGYQQSFLCNLNLEEMKGLSCSGISNYTVRRTKGVQFSSVLNYSGQLTGLQLTGITNIAQMVDRGAQLALMNIARMGNRIWQVGMSNVCDRSMKGVQLGFVNVAQQVKGTQLGILNLAMGKVKGMQIGIINTSKDTTAIKLGLVNVTPKTEIQTMAFIGNRSKFNLAIRFLNHLHYTIVGFGTHYRGLDRDFSGNLFYRSGWRWQIFSKAWLSIDGGFVHIENFKSETDYLPERMYALQFCTNFELKCNNKLSLFVSGGYSWARYYQKNKTFERKPILEMGVLLFKMKGKK